MPIATLAQRNAMAAAYGVAAPFAAAFSSDPGTSGTVVGECVGGSPAYNRVSAAWGTPAASAIVGTATFNIASGTTLTFVGYCVSGTPATSDLRDRTSVTSQGFSSQGTYALTATYTQT